MLYDRDEIKRQLTYYEVKSFMKITYIYHSSFLIETGSAYFLFDYELGNIPDLLPDRPLYVLASHAHGDHFNPRIFRLRRNHPDVRYILSDDIPAEMIHA